MNTPSSMTGMQRHAPRRHTKELKTMTTTNNNTKTESIEIEYPAMFVRRFYQKKVTAPLSFAAVVELPTQFGLSNAHVMTYRCFPSCDCCGERIWYSLMITGAGGELYCPTCVKEHTILCASCGNPVLFDHPNFSARQFGTYVRMGDNKHLFLCNACVRNTAFACGDCGEVHEAIGCVCHTNNAGRRICNPCWDRYTRYRIQCAICSSYITQAETLYNDAGRSCCPSCWANSLLHELHISSQKPRKLINSYGHTDGTVFVSTVGGAVRFYGLELEADNGIEDTDDQPTRLREELYPWVEFILKSDSSIDGIETVSVPLTLDYIRNHLRLGEWCEIMKKYNFEADDPKVSAGMHIHISRDAFGDTARKQNRAIAAFSYLLLRNDFRPQIKEFSRRRGDYHYCGFYYASDYEETTITKVLPKLIAENRRSRNRVLNFVNPATVEVRLFKGSLRKSTIVASVELLDLFADIAIAPWTEASIRALTWADICNRVPETSGCLKSYLKRRKIWEGN